MLIIDNNISTGINSWLKTHKHSKYFVLVDENTRKFCLPKLKLKVEFSIIQIISGEKNKNLDTCQTIWNKLLENKADRNALLINLGGGVICDMGGFCASTYKRGIDFINIPTTLLSQVDASVGSKTGIDFNHQKNMIGLFSEAKAVLIDSIFLKTLSKREVLSGFAEVLKHGLIHDEKYFIECVSKYFKGTINWNKAIKKSVEIKSYIVKKDPKEKGLRKVLNFGHTIGHALETYSLIYHENPILHGEAVVLGMISELFLSYKKKYISKINLDSTIADLLSIYTFKNIEIFDFKEISNLVLNDKKNDDGNTLVVLLKSIGNATYKHKLSNTELLDSLLFLNQKLTNA